MKTEENVEVEETIDEDDVLYYLDTMVLDSDSAETAKIYAEAYKARADADAKLTDEYYKVKEIENDRFKSKLVFAGTVVAAAIGATITGVCKIVGDIMYAREIERIEKEENIIVNSRKYKK